MKIVLYDKCWDAILKLPKSIQKKVPEFIRKFRENSKSSGLHLEPISTFKDSNLRTARVDQKYRAILRAPISGDVYHLLWIDNHDEAMQWAENKFFSWNDNIQSYQVFTAPEIVEENTAKSNVDKILEEGFYDAYSNDDLVKIGVPSVLLPSIRKIQGIEDLDAIEKYLPVEAFENLFYLLDGENIDRIIGSIKEGTVSSDSLDEQTKSANNQRSFFELTDDLLLNEMLSGELYKWKIYLHPSQRALVVSDFNGATKVTGGAGTGKTVAALHRTKFLLDNDLGRNNKPVLFTTYTKSLTHNLAKFLPGLGIDSSQVVLTNIDNFVREEAIRLGLIDSAKKILDYPDSKKSIEVWDETLDIELTEFKSSFLEAEWKQVILFNNIKTEQEYFGASRKGRQLVVSKKDKVQIWNLFQSYQKKKKEQNYVDREEVFNALYEYYNAIDEKPFGHIVADEIQDFSNVELRLLRVLVEEKRNDLFLVGDPLQRIYSRTLNFSNVGINVRGRRSRRLKINYRTTEEIRRVASSMVQNIPYDNFDGEVEEKKGYISLRHGLTPFYQVFKDKSEELDFIIEKLNTYTDRTKENTFLLSDICLAARTRNTMKEVLSYLHNKNVSYFDLTTGKGNQNSGVRLSTFHNMKGLEFKVVFLVDVNSQNLPFRPYSYSKWDETSQKEYDKSEKALLYVAMTRTIHVLHLTGVGDKSSILENLVQ